MNSAQAQSIYNQMRTATLNARKEVSIESSESGKMGLDFMTEHYQINHIDIIGFMGSEEVFSLLKDVVPESGRGYVQIFVRQVENGKFEYYGVKFVEYHVMHKYWGLGYKNANPKDYFFFECLYENDYTKFRGCIRK